MSGIFCFFLAHFLKRKRCRDGHGSFFFGYEKLKEEGNKKTFRIVEDLEYFQSSPNFYFEIQFLKQIELQIGVSATAFQQQALVYSTLHGVEMDPRIYPLVPQIQSFQKRKILFIQHG